MIKGGVCEILNGRTWISIQNYIKRENVLNNDNMHMKHKK